MKKNQKIQNLTFLAVFTAIILLMGFTPIGYIKTLGLEITLLVIPVVIGAILLGPKAGTFLGFMFGVTSLIQAISGLSPFGAMLFGLSPIKTIILCIIPRTLMGFLVGVIFKALNNKLLGKSNIFAHIIACVSGALLNTIFFMSLLCFFFYNTDEILAFRNQLGSTNVLNFIILFVGINGLVEAIVNFVIGSFVSKTLFIIFKRS